MIIGVIDKKVSYMALPKAIYTPTGFEINSFSNPDNLHLFKHLNTKNTIIGVSGSLSISDSIRYLTLFRGNLTLDKLLNKVIPAIKKALSEAGKIDNDGFMNATICIAQNHQFYSIDYKFNITKHNHHFATTGDFTDASLSIHKSEKPLQKIYKTIKTELDFNHKHALPIAVIDTKNPDVYYINGLEDL